MNSRHHGIIVIALFAAVAAGSTACSSSGSDTSTAAEGSPATTLHTAVVPHLDPKAFEATINQSGTVLLDVRTAAEFAEGHIATAKNVDAQASDFTQKLKTLDKTATYAIYCHSGKRSAAAAQLMTAAGFTKVEDLAGGVAAWTAAGKQLTTG
jgi:rhodanese-related sulfurtransferase